MLSIEPFVSRHFQDDYMTYGNPATDLRVNCPFCDVRYGKPDYSHKLYISIVKQTCHCFRCSYKKSWVQLVQDLTGLPYISAVGELYVKPKVAKWDVISEKVRVDTIRKSFVSLPKDFVLISNERTTPYQRLRGLVSAAAKYLEGRGFGLQLCMHYSLGVSQELGYRVVIPIEEDYWQARAIYDFIQPKYTAPSVENRHYLFNAQALDNYDEVVICEGAFSAIAVGFNAVATLSHNVTKEQMTRLCNASVSHYIIASEPGLLRASYDVAEALNKRGKRVTIWDYQDGDPAQPGAIVTHEYSLRNKVHARLYS